MILYHLSSFIIESIFKVGAIIKDYIPHDNMSYCNVGR